MQQGHHSQDPQRVSCAVVTVSDTRTLQTDRGGELIVRLLEENRHQVARRILVRDEPDEIRPVVTDYQRDDTIQAILLTGGTGIAPRDQTCETLGEMFTKPLPGYGELFRWLSYEEIGPAAMLSRATGGVIDGTVVLTMPGSPNAVRLAMERLIVPQLGHLVREATK